MTAEEVTERLALVVHHSFCPDCLPDGPCPHQKPCPEDYTTARAVQRWFADVADPEDLALLQAGRPIEERAQAAGMEPALGPAKGRAHYRGRSLWVAIPEKETP